MHKAVNFLLYYVAWLVCVLSMQSVDRWWWPLLVVALVVGWHLFRSQARHRDLICIAVATLLGPLVDVILLLAGVVVVPISAGQIHGGLPPLAMILLWPAFATTFHSSLAWLLPHKVLLAACAFVGAPLAYVGAETLVAGLQLRPDLPLAALLIGVVWALCLPLIVICSTALESWLVVGTRPE